MIVENHISSLGLIGRTKNEVEVFIFLIEKFETNA